VDRNRFNQQYAALRRDIIEGEYSALNDMQKEAVFKTEGPVLVLAGAGSGKTTVLINRISNIVRFGSGYECNTAPEDAGDEALMELVEYSENPVRPMPERIQQLCAVAPAKPWNILAITFTNKAASELKTRLERALGPSAGDIWASTFHSACVRILRRDIKRLGFDTNFTIYDDDEHLNLLKAVLREHGLDEKAYAPRYVASVISRAKDELKMPVKFAKEHAGDPRMQPICEAYADYQKRLKAANALDFDDIIMYAVALLANYEDVRTYYQQKFRYIMIDEYQDTNRAQYLLAKLLAGEKENICVVGDDDQSIYKFRGADIENILGFERCYADATVIRLEQNYRSTGTILNAANNVIRNNTARKGKELWTKNDDGEKISFYHALSEQEEAQYIAAQILGEYSKGRSPRDCAILYRLNAQSNMLENAMQRNGIPYRIVGGMRFYDRAEVRDMFSYLWAIFNHGDDLRLKRIVNVPARKISDKRVEEAMAIAARENVSLYEVLRTAKSYGVFDRAAVAMETFANLLEELRLSADAMPLDEFYDRVLERTGYLAMLEAKTDAESIARAQNVREIRTNIMDYMATHDHPCLEEFLGETALFTDIDRYDAGADAVVLMTLHSAKGLEFPVVFMCGMEEGIFPGVRAMDDEAQMEEERRLCYVGMTRAKRHLYMTCTHARTIFGKTAYNRVSRFMEEVPAECLNKPIPTRRRPEAERTTEGSEAQPVSRSPYRRRAAMMRDMPPRAGTPASLMQSMENRHHAPAKPLLMRTGDVVEHAAFGTGRVTQLTPMGGDMLVTISFDRAGQKRLMASSAAKFMKVVSHIRPERTDA